MKMKQELIELLCHRSFRYSPTADFKLVSGRMSQFYVDCKPTTLHPHGMFLVGNLMFDAIKRKDVSAVGGLTFGADPIAIATAFASECLRAFSIRKTQKDHGIVKWIEGDISLGERVAIIDDVVTTGGSTIKAIERARNEGMGVIAVVILVDRQEGGLENIRQHVEDVSAIITREELMERYEKKKSIKNRLSTI